MVKPLIHILNGDALLNRFPEEIEGERIVFRECLIEGPIQEKKIEAFLSSRKKYLTERYPKASISYQEVETELMKIEDIHSSAEVNLWFEDDLFCQINFWYCVSRLLANKHEGSIFLLRPETSLELGFGGCDTRALTNCFDRRMLLDIKLIEKVNALWIAHTQQKETKLKSLKNHLELKYRFISDAVQALLSHNYVEESVVVTTLKKIIEEEGTSEIKTVFPIFFKALPIYGFGDLQIKWLIEDIN